MKQIAFAQKIALRKVAGFGLIGLFLIAATLAVVFSFTPRAQAAAGIYHTINFQGKVVNTNGTNVADGTYTFRFRIYTGTSGDTTTPCANTCQWEETKSLTTVNGIFQTNLGDTTTLPGSVNFNTDSEYVSVLFNGDTEMTPRIHLTAAPYAFNADLLDGLDSSALVQLSPGSQQTGAVNVSGNITSGGTVNANTIDAATAGALTIGSANASSLSLAKNTNLASGLTLSLQGNNALNLGSTTAAGGIVFKDGTVNNRTVTLGTLGLTASYTLNLPTTGASAGLQCIQTASGSTTNLTFGSCGATGTYVSLQAGTPGTADSGNFNITGVGIASSFNSASFDATTSGLMTIGGSAATSITIGNIALATGTQTVNVGTNATSGGTTNVTVGTSGSASGTTTVQASGTLNLTGGSASTWSVSGTNASLTMSANGSGTAFINSGASGTISIGANNVANKIVNIGSVGSTGQASTVHIADTNTNSYAQQVVIGSISTAANITTIQGGNGTGAVGIQAAASGTISIGTSNTNNINVGSSTAVVAIAGTSALTIKGTSGANTTTFGFTTPTAARSILLPDAGGTLCIQSSTACGFATGTSASYIQNQIAAAQTSSNFWISGTGAAGSLQASTNVLTPLLDASGASTPLAIGTTYASVINLNQSTALAAGKNLTFTAGAGNFDQSASTGTFATGSGTVGLNGSTTVATGKTLTVTAGASTLTGASGGSSTAVIINSGAASNVGAVVKGATSQSVDLFDLQDVSGNVNAGFSSGGNSLTLGRVAASGTVTSGNLLFADGTTDNFSSTVKVGSTLTASQTINLGNQSGTICIQSSASCGFATGTTGSYIQNQIAGAQASSNFWINGTGVAASFQTAVSVLTPLLDTPSGTTTLAIGTTNATAGINLNQNTSLAAGKNLTFASGAGTFDQSGSTGTFKTGTGAISINGDETHAAGKSVTYAAGAGNFDQSASTGTFATGTGNNNLNGNTTIASGKTLVANGDTTIKDTSATALQIQNTAGTATLFGFDSSAGTLTLGTGATRTIQVGAAGAGVAGNNLALTGGASGSGAVNGGNLVLSGGASGGSGVQGLVTLSPTTFTASSLQTNSITAGYVDAYSSIPVTANTTGLTITVPSPVNATIGRVLYITAASSSNDFTLFLSGTSISIAIKANSTATLIWNGTGWTAAGASSSTDLQSAYNNTLTSAGGAELVLNNTASSNGLTIRNNAANPIIGAEFEVQSSIGTNILSVNNNATELAANGGVETSSSFATDWTALGAPTITRNTTLANVATGQASVQVATTAVANTGVRNNLSSSPAVSTTYQVSLTGKLSSGTFTTLDVEYSRNGGTTLTNCDNSLSTTLVTTGWSKVTCTFTTDATAATDPDLLIRQTDATARTFWIDNLSVTLLTTTSTPPNVQIGGGLYGGAPTLLTLDRASSPPVAAGNTALLGSMYYDTTSGRIQCYEADGWGACGSSPDNYVNLVPEFPGAVLDGSGIGTLTSDFCSNQSGVLSVNSTLCSSGQALNYYHWTSPQATQQTYSIYVTYQLPAAFKQFQSDTTVQLTARTDNTTNGVVSYNMYRSQGGALSACGTETTVTSTANTWQTVGINGNELSGCGFDKTSANSFAIFQINVKANSNANVYIGTLSFTTNGQ